MQYEKPFSIRGNGRFSPRANRSRFGSAASAAASLCFFIPLKQRKNLLDLMKFPCSVTEYMVYFLQNMKEVMSDDCSTQQITETYNG